MFGQTTRWYSRTVRRNFPNKVAVLTTKQGIREEKLKLKNARGNVRLAGTNHPVISNGSVEEESEYPGREEGTAQSAAQSMEIKFPPGGLFGESRARKRQ